MAIHTEKQEKLTMHDVADLLGSFNDFDEIDYRIEECATKGCVAIVYFYEDKLIKIGNKNGVVGKDWYWGKKTEKSLKQTVEKPILNAETWVGMYAELSYYFENKCFPNRITHDKNGNRTEESEDDFADIVDTVETIMHKYLKKEE